MGSELWKVFCLLILFQHRNASQKFHFQPAINSMKFSWELYTVEFITWEKFLYTYKMYRPQCKQVIIF